MDENYNTVVPFQAVGAACPLTASPVIVTGGASSSQGDAMDAPDTIADVDARLDLERQAYLAAEQAGDLDDATRHWHAMDALLDVRCGMRREATT